MGGVSGTYVQGGAGTTGNGKGKPGELVHVLADHAAVSGGGATATFYGGSKPARMWTPTSQMEAAVIETDRSSGRLLAHGVAAADRVHLSLPQAAASAGTKPVAAESGGVVRITGGTLLYTPAEGVHAAHADVSGGVRMDESGSVLTAATAVATLGAPATQDGMLGGKIESMLATGAVRLQQPGRTATGERLLYTAADGRYELTGTTSAPPHVADSLRGTVTGSTLVFHGEDDNLEVLGEPGRRVHTETQASRPSRSR